jgi:hypothetical protein
MMLARLYRRQYIGGPGAKKGRIFGVNKVAYYDSINNITIIQNSITKQIVTVMRKKK